MSSVTYFLEGSPACMNAHAGEGVPRHQGTATASKAHVAVGRHLSGQYCGLIEEAYFYAKRGTRAGRDQQCPKL
eukprot:scaffold50408_cov28-Tisochrysis_lutea.AAC.4